MKRQLADAEKLRAILANERIFRLAELIPDIDKEKGGRPLEQPKFMYLVFGCAVWVYRSARNAELQLATQGIQSFMRKALLELYPSDASRRLPSKPMTRRQFGYMKRTHLSVEPFATRFREAFEACAAEQALEMGLGSASAGGSLNRPAADRMIYADGKVVKAMYKASSGAVWKGTNRPKRVDPSAAHHLTGGGYEAYGTKHIIASIRGKDAHARVVLSTDYSAPAGGEMEQVLPMVKRLAKLLPGAQGLLYDGTLRGRHSDKILKETGLLPIFPVTADDATDPKNVIYTPKHVESFPATLPDGRQIQVSLRARQGQIGLIALNRHGEEVFQPLKRIRIKRERRKDNNQWRWSATYQLPQQFGGGEYITRLDRTPQDQLSRFNRTEHVRGIAPPDPEFKEIYSRRADAESINRQLDDWCWLRRAHSLGAEAQCFDMLAFGLVVNSMALKFHRDNSTWPDLMAA